MAPAMLMRPGPFALANRVSPDAPRRAPHSPRLPARLNVRSSTPAVVNTVDASTHRTSRVFRVLRRARVVTRAASTGGVWQWWSSADAWADDAWADDAGSDAVHSTTDVSIDGGEIEAATSDRVNFSHDNPWRTVALILGAMLVAALVHPPLASASSTLIASITANVVTPAILVGSYPAVSYIVAGVNAWATNAVGVAATLVSSAASAGAGYAAASARARVEMDALRTEIAHIKRDVAASFGAGPGVQSAAVVASAAGAGVGTAASASTVEDANVNAAVATATATGDQPVVDAERRARVEAELADLRRQLARLRAVWTPEADEVVDDAGAEVADGTDVGGGSSPAVAVDVAGDVDWGAVAKSRALWSPGADDSSGAGSSSSLALGADDSTDGTIVVGAAAMDEDTAARIAAELAALKLELAGVRASTAADHSSVPAGETADIADADAAGGEMAGSGSGARPGVGGSGPGAGSVDWAALAKSRAVWSPSDDDGDGTEVDVDGVASSGGPTALGSAAGSAVASEDAERVRLLEEDLMWRRRMGMRENAQDDQPLGH